MVLDVPEFDQHDVCRSTPWQTQNSISQDPTKAEAIVRPSSSGRKADKSSAKGGSKYIGDIKDILELAGEFKEMVTQMAFEKFDFHQWFRCVRVRRDNKIMCGNRVFYTNEAR